MANGLNLVLANLERFEEGLRTRLEAALTKIMLDLEADAKANHPYTDQTGANTASITGFVAEVTDTVISGKLSAGMEYSEYLETMKDGKYAYLWPAIERRKDAILSVLTAAAGSGASVQEG